jgi:hypothetical protein
MLPGINLDMDVVDRVRSRHYLPALRPSEDQGFVLLGLMWEATGLGLPEVDLRLESLGVRSGESGG